MKRYALALNHEMVSALASCTISSKTRRTSEKCPFKAATFMVLRGEEPGLRFCSNLSKYTVFFQSRFSSWKEEHQ